MSSYPIVVREIPTVIEANTTKYIGQENIETVAGLEEALAERVVSRPTSQMRQVLNMFWDPIREEFVIEISDTSEE